MVRAVYRPNTKPTIAGRIAGTANGLAASAAALNNILLILNEVSECDPREIGVAVEGAVNFHTLKLFSVILKPM